MRPFPALLTAAAGVAVVGSYALGAQPAPEPAGGPESSMSPTQEASCWLMRGTPEEAAQRPSPLGETDITLGGQAGKICYSRPSMRGRVIFGELEEYGAPWRTGANEATALHLPFPASVGGVELDPGSYSLYTIPGEAEWEVVLNGNAQRWGIPINAEVREADVGSFMVPAESTGSPVEQLTFRWEAQGQNMGHLIMEWENTRIRIPVSGGGM